MARSTTIPCSEKEVTILDTDKQALLNYLLGNGVQQEKPASHVIRQKQAVNTATPAPKVTSPLWERVKTK